MGYSLSLADIDNRELEQSSQISYFEKHNGVEYSETHYTTNSDYIQRRIPRKLIDEIDKSSLSNKHSCGLYNYMWLLGNSETYRCTGKDVTNRSFRAFLQITIRDLCAAFKARTTHICFSMLDQLQNLGLIKYVRNKMSVTVFIRGYKRNQLCTEKCHRFELSAIRNHKGFVFANRNILDESFRNISGCSPMDALLFLWLHTVYNDDNYPISRQTAFTVFPTNIASKGNSGLQTTLDSMAFWWNCSKSKATHILSQLQENGFITPYLFHSIGLFVVINHYSELLWDIPSQAATREEIQVKLLHYDPDPAVQKQKQKIAKLVAISNYYKRAGLTNCVTNMAGKISQAKFRFLMMKHLLPPNLGKYISTHKNWLSSWIQEKEFNRIKSSV